MHHLPEIFLRQDNCEPLQQLSLIQSCEDPGMETDNSTIEEVQEQTPDDTSEKVDEPAEVTSNETENKFSPKKQSAVDVDLCEPQDTRKNEDESLVKSWAAETCLPSTQQEESCPVEISIIQQFKENSSGTDEVLSSVDNNCDNYDSVNNNEKISTTVTENTQI